MVRPAETSPDEAPLVTGELRMDFSKRTVKVRGREATGRQMQTWVRFPDVGWKVVAAQVSAITETPVL